MTTNTIWLDDLPEQHFNAESEKAYWEVVDDGNTICLIHWPNRSTNETISISCTREQYIDLERFITSLIGIL